MKIPRLLALMGAMTLLALTAVAQIPNQALAAPSRWRATSGLIPIWRFFAPDPGVHDHHLLGRYRDRMTSASPWIEVLHSPDAAWWNSMWNPRQREKKALLDITARLLILAPQGTAAVSASHEFATLSAWVLRRLKLRGARDVEGFEFMIVRSRGREVSTPEIVLRSPYIRPPKENDDTDV